ncbi:ATP synthase F1 subunit gamma [Clostridium folliculivorans]|uniref:ATP synthase gamma chain n=1 Tax=Clostridium folliculivorans TaxID=2886038 RepID=A0A9W5XYF1_9CLOT|nr:ATP synthase F1 subunit gamma [Clostridium folliculivorans]GKU23316.1 ATP synthase gamma chain [Clostridium folliculivorans]GKU29433.1 ATP synthase gamma chain [Clostridium folliculivorans]
MAGAGLLDIKRRIKSVTNTKKITKAMGLVATSKLRKARMELETNNRYFNSIQKVADELIKSIDDDNNSIYIKGNKSAKKLYIVLTSDSGLCGGFNHGVASQLNEVAGFDTLNNVVMVVGQKGISYVKKYGFETIAEYVQISDIPTVKEAKTVVEHALRLYKDSEVGEVNVVYTHFYSPVRQLVTVDKLLPIDRNEDKDAKRNDFLIEPNSSSIVENTFDIYFRGKLLNSLLHSKASEQNSRMQAMDGATKNANDLLDAYNIKYNRIRQGAITQEISEIVSGANAQK